MTRFRTTAVLAGSLLALGAADAAAQTPIRMGQTVRGALAASDPTAEDGSYYDLFSYTGRRGERLSVNLTSSAFDAFVSLGQMQGGEFKALQSDDDGAGGTDARLEVTLPSDGTFVIRANSLSEGETGAYTLALARGAAPRPNPAVQTGSIRVGQTVRGTLAATDPRLEGDDTYYDLHRFTGRAGQRVEISMASTAFDSYLAFGRMEAGELNVLRSDDDGGGWSDARIRATRPANGDYVILSNSLNKGETGAYTVTLRELPPLPAPPAPAAIRAGQTVRGTLATTDGKADDDSYVAGFAYTGRAGERLTISMESDAFDTYLLIGRMVNDRFERLESNDDAGEDGTDSQIVFTLPAAGTYVIRANSRSAESTGAYTLTVQSAK